MRAVLLVNPAAGRGRGERFLERFQAPTGVDLEVCVTQSRSDLIERSARATQEGTDRLIIAGGDGSLHLALPALAGTTCALGIVPTGRGNDLARVLGVPREPLGALRLALTAPVRRIDLGRASGRVYASVAGVGFDGEVAALAARPPRFIRGAAVYPYSVLRVLGSFVSPRLRVDHDEGFFEGRAMMALAANAPAYGGGMRVAPDAKLDDGLLDLVVVEHLTLRRALALFPRVYRGTHVRDPAVHVVRTRRAEVVSDRPMVPFADGEPLLSEGSCHFTFEAVPGSILVCAAPPSEPAVPPGALAG